MKIEFPETYHDSRFNIPGLYIESDDGFSYLIAADERGIQITEFTIQELPEENLNKNTELGTEINDELNYNSTDSLVKGWDFTLELGGRIYYFNPYTNKRYVNLIMVSHISPSNAFMWDLASASNFREAGLKSGDNIVGAILLPTTEILIIKNKSAQILSDDGLVGILREPIEGITCVSRASITIINGTVYLCGIDEIYSLSTSIGKRPLLKQTIRDLYLAIENKELIRAIRDRWDTYRIRIYDTENRTEFLLTENGWVEESKYHFPVIYREDFKSKLNFMATDGKIYGTLYAIENIGYGRLYSTKYGQRL